MSQSTAALLGAIAGFTVFIGLPIARLRGLKPPVQGFLNAIATGVLVFLLWDILTHASAPVESAVGNLHKGNPQPFLLLAFIFAAALGVGLLSLVYLNGRLLGKRRDTPVAASPKVLSMMIATGLGLHNLSEGLAIGQSAATGAVAFAGVLVIGFALHNVTEGFGIAAPMSLERSPVSWGFIGMAGLVGGGPTFIGTVLGYVVVSPYAYVLFLALAAGALLYVINELFALGRRLCKPQVLAWGLLIGFLAAYSTDLFLTYLAV
jgi:ZIP family zinc transporter